MLPNVPREYTQFVSLAFIAVGLFLLLFSTTPFIGVACIGVSCWVLMISESVLHNKIQAEMSSALEGLRKKQEADIQDLLYFLRQSQIAADPMSSWEAAKNFIAKIQFPAMAMSRDFGIVKANKLMTNILGYHAGELDGAGGHRINNAFLMSTISEMYSRPPISEKSAVHSRYVYIDKSGKEIYGLMCATKIADMGYFIVFHPDSDNIIQDDNLKKILARTRSD